MEWNSEEPTLAAGKYLIKAYVDRNHTLADNPTAMLGEKEYFGQGELQANWEKGFPKAQKITGALFK